MCLAASVFLSAQTNQNSAPSGIEGTVLIGPLRGGPVPTDRPSEGPLETVLVIKRLPGSEVAVRVRTDEKGYFHVELAPGRYCVINEPDKPDPTGRRMQGAEVIVRPHRFSVLRLRIDTGLR
jgi:hypothetical protein